MPARKRVPHTEAWDAIQQMCLWPEQKHMKFCAPNLDRGEVTPLHTLLLTFCRYSQRMGYSQLLQWLAGLPGQPLDGLHCPHEVLKLIAFSFKTLIPFWARGYTGKRPIVQKATQQFQVRLRLRFIGA